MLRRLFLVGLTISLLALTISVSALSGEEPEATSDNLSELSWLVGGWRGEAFGGVCEEVWFPAAGGKMVGTFRLVVGDRVGFYELMTIENGPEGFTLRLKHFNADLTGWEARDEVKEFGPHEVGPGVASFQGIAYRPLGVDSLLIILQDEQADGSHERTELRFGRFDPFD